MNYQITDVMVEYRPEHERMIWGLGLSGNAFKKVYFDPNLNRQVSIFVPAEDLIVPYGASNLETADRVTHVMRKTENELRRLQVAGFYRDVDLLDQLDPYSVKPKYFDILLGWPKLHRDVIFNFINNTNLQDQVIMTYFQDRSKPVSQQGIWDIDFSPGIMYTVTQINVQNRYASISQIIPLSIYNQTAYTVVAETNYSNHYSFYTEKIVKPILAERLFIVFSGQHYLRNLRSLGFKTFDGIIDETYDIIADFDQRGQMITEQMIYLFSQDQQIILDKIKPIVEYNYKLMIETDWYGDFFKELQAVLLAHTD
jgi:hypothetical protein